MEIRATNAVNKTTVVDSPAKLKCALLIYVTDEQIQIVEYVKKTVSKKF